MEWRHSGSPRSKNSECKFQWKNSRLNFLGSRRHPPHWLPSKVPNHHRGVLFISAGAIEVHFEGKSRGNFTKCSLFLHDNAPAHWALATQKKLAYLGFQIHYHPHYSPDLAPSAYHLFPGLKKQSKIHHFFRHGCHSCRGDVVGRTKLWIFFEWFVKVKKWANNCIELRGDYVE